MIRLRRVSAAAFVAVGLLAAPSGTGAHTAAFDSRVTIRVPEPGTYRGRVISEREKCQPGRTVKIFRAADDSLVGTATTNAAGKWVFRFIGERYYAKVTRRVDGTGTHSHVCRADRSPTTY